MFAKMHIKIFAIVIILCAIHTAESSEFVEQVKSGFKTAGSAIKSTAKSAYCGVKKLVSTPCEPKTVHAVVEEVKQGKFICSIQNIYIIFRKLNLFS